MKKSQPAQKDLYNKISELISESRKHVVQNINYTILFTNFYIGKYIVEDEQQGEERAEYSKKILNGLSKKLIKNFGRGFSVDNLENMRKFFLQYSHRISATLSRKFIESSSSNSETLSRKSQKTQPLSAKSPTVSRISETPFQLSWSHYVLLLKIDNEDERSFYEIESAENNWSVRELQRQYNSSLYERVALSKNKTKVKELGKKGQIISTPTDLLKEPYVLEFLNLKEETAYTESQLEQAIINRIEIFLLELGKGFLFDSRQKRISLNEDNFYIDLVFYNRLLKCFVLIDLKIGKLMHQDIGQMQMYVNYFDRKIKGKDESKTVGIVLCKETNKTVVEFTLPEENDQIYAREYKLYLPSKKELQKLLKD
ncbi:MAG: PDDEXK nuclease domain-containing protein [Ignavibacteriaceae bacterium]|nr:PDDEXK nuclease domain-containing protein [Ignavibacteriaceae bacterium]